MLRNSAPHIDLELWFLSFERQDVWLGRSHVLLSNYLGGAKNPDDLLKVVTTFQ